MDTDGDGVSDWAEIVTGFDPNDTHSNGAAQDDHTALTAQLANENIITLRRDRSLHHATARRRHPAGQLRDRSPSAAAATLNFSTITVPLLKSGTAIEGTDYLPAPTFRHAAAERQLP